LCFGERKTDLRAVNAVALPTSLRVDDEDAHARTLAALHSLPAALRKILVLREVEGLPMEEVASRLRLSRPAAERRWMRAIVLMAERLAEKEGRR
jgi:DNA-directed RNA polymerase specialized sigma24 family protein